MAKKDLLVYQIKVTLKDTKPPIWRRILVLEDTTLLKLHDILQIVMGWQDYHLHMFTLDGENYGDPANDEFGDLGIMPEHEFKLSDLIHGAGQRFTYEYDFGDGWIHALRVEEIGPRRAGVRYPTCTAGRRACPPEDVGGVWGYQRFLEAIHDPAHPEHEEYLTWIGGQFDPAGFDLEAINAGLREMGRGRSTELLEGNTWIAIDPELSKQALTTADSWLGSLPAEERAVAEALPLRRDVVALLTYLRDHRVTGTSSLGNLPLKAVRAVCALFVDPPPLEDRIGERVYPVRSESEVWPLYFRHVLASLAGLIQGGPGRRWRLTPLGEEYLAAAPPAQVGVLWLTWWTQTNWAIASRYGFETGQVSRWFVRQTLDHLLDLEPGESVPFREFADGLIEDAGLLRSAADPQQAKRSFRHDVRRSVIGPLADFGALETLEDPERVAGVRLWFISSFRVTPFGRRLLERTPRTIL